MLGVHFEYGDVADFARAIKHGSGIVKSRVNVADRRVADLVVDHAQAAAGGVGRQAVKAAASLRAGSAGRGASVTGGGSLRWFEGAEFGSLRWGQFKPWRGAHGNNAFEGGAGYFLFPSIRASKQEILSEYRDEVLTALRPAFR